MKSLQCPRCGGQVDIPEELSDEMRKTIARLAKPDTHLLAMKLLRDEAGFSIGQAKLLVTHLSLNGECHHCPQRLGDRGEVICPRCKSLNLNW